MGNGNGKGEAFAHGGTGRGRAYRICDGKPVGYAAEPPAHSAPATPEMMQLVRDEHDLVADMIKAQLAAERDRYAEQRTAISASPGAVGTASVPRALSSVRGRRNS